MIPLSSVGLGPKEFPLAPPATKGGDFGSAMKEAEARMQALSPSASPKNDGIGPVGEYLNEVNRLQIESQGLQSALASGQDVELHDVMIASEKASIAMQTTLALRNKLLEAYQEVMRMQV